MLYVLIDRFLEMERGVHVRAVKCVTRGEPFMAGRDHYPPPLVLESLFQAGGALIRSESGFRRLSALGKVERAEFPGVARPGDAVEIEVRAVLSRAEGKLCEGTATVDGRVIAKARFMMLFAPPELEPPFDEPRARSEYLRRRALRMPVELEEE